MILENKILKMEDISEGDFSSREEGRDTLVLILKWWRRAERITLDFSDNLIASTSFVDEVFGTLAMLFSNEELQEKLELINIDPIDRRMINSTIHSRREELKEIEASKK